MLYRGASSRSKARENCNSSHVERNTPAIAFALLFVLGFEIATVVSLKDLRLSIERGFEPCFEFDANENVFQANCVTLNWMAAGYDESTFISLRKGETFDGGGIRVNLSGIAGLRGLFKVDSSVKSFEDSPLIKNVHTTGGALADSGGYILQKNQEFARVESCSSSGPIGQSAGGICGRDCAIRGHVSISNCFATGNIVGSGAGGIVSLRAGSSQGLVNITNCYSTGEIRGPLAGGICGTLAAEHNGRVLIFHSFSTGNILATAEWAGGIIGGHAGAESGYVSIKECYTTGIVSAPNSGGICGGVAAHAAGRVFIEDCYSIGSIKGTHSGGICGGQTGGEDAGRSGDVFILNTYASGYIDSDNEAGGVIGSTGDAVTGTIQVNFSVYDGDSGALVGNQVVEPMTHGLSTNLRDIQGKLYQSGFGNHKWSETVWAVTSVSELPVLRFQGTPPMPIARSTFVRNSGSPSAVSNTVPVSPHKRSIVEKVSANPTACPTNSSGHLLRGCDSDRDISELYTLIGISKENASIGLHILNFDIMEKRAAGSVSVSVACQKDIPLRLSNYTVFSGCSEAFSGSSMELPIPIAVDIVDQESIRCNETDYTQLAVGLNIAENSTGALRSQVSLLDSSETKSSWLLVPLKLNFRSEDECVGKSSVYLFLGYGSLVSSMMSDKYSDASNDIWIEPSFFHVMAERKAGRTNMTVTKSVVVIGKGKSLWRWAVPPSLSSTVSVEAGVHEFSQEFQSVMQHLEFDLSALQLGSTQFEIPIEIIKEDGTVGRGASVKGVIDVLGAFVVGDNLGEISIRLPSGNPRPVSKTLMMGNEGTLPLQWNATLYSRNGTLIDVLAARGIVQMDTSSGTIEQGQSIGIPIYFSSIDVAESQIINFWLLITTDATDGSKNGHAAETPYWYNDEIQGMHMWASLQVIISSVFVCAEDMNHIPLRPFEHKTYQLTVLNTWRGFVKVMPHNFSVSFSNMSKTYKVIAGGDQRLQLAPWLYFSVSKITVKPGLSTVISLHVEYPSETLRLLTEEHSEIDIPARGFTLLYSLMVQPNGPEQAGTEIISREMDILLMPGKAAPAHSSVTLSPPPYTPSTVVNVEVQLVDFFGRSPAMAKLVDETGSSGSETQLTMDLRWRETTWSTFDLRQRFFPRIRWNSDTESFRFDLRLPTMGRFAFDARINNESLQGMPRVLDAILMCNRSNSVPDRKGISCLCEAGFYLSEDDNTCFRCSEGSINSKPSQNTDCSPCPMGFYSNRWNTECLKCPDEGFECIRGKLRMRNGFWCKRCSESFDIPNVEALGKMHKCPVTTACSVESESFHVNCSAGYTGPVCSICEPDFVKSATAHCLKCENTEWNAFFSVSLLALLVGGMSTVIYRHYREYVDQYENVAQEDKIVGEELQSRSISQNAKQDRLNEKSRNPLLSVSQGNHCPNANLKNASVENPLWNPDYRSTPTSETSNVLLDKGDSAKNPKAVQLLVLSFLDYMQIMSILFSLKVSPMVDSGNSVILQILEMSTLSPSRADPVRCATHIGFFEASLISMALPWLISLASVFVLWTIHTMQRTKVVSTWLVTSNAFRSLVTLLGVAHMGVTSSALQAVELYPFEIGSVRRHMYALDLKVGTFKSKVLMTAGYLTLTLFVVGFPVAVTVYLLRNSQKTSTAEMKQFNKVIEGYRKARKGFLWPAIVMLRKVLLLLVAVMVGDAIEQMVFAALILFGSYALLNALKPYYVASVNYVELFKVFTVLGSLWLGTVQFGLKNQPVEEISTVDDTGVLVPLALINISLAIGGIITGIYLMPGALKYLYSRFVFPLLSKCGASPPPIENTQNPSENSDLPQSELHSSSKSLRNLQNRKAPKVHPRSLRHLGVSQTSVEESRQELLRGDSRGSGGNNRKRAPAPVNPRTTSRRKLRNVAYDQR